jgi:cation diffusion facilitator family transporter
VTLEYEEQRKLMNTSLAVALLLLGLKVVAAAKTGSSAIFSDAAESVVHALAVCFAWWALRISHKPADETHHFGHDKVAFLSIGFEGAMISAAAFFILYEAGKQIWTGVEISNLGLGMALTGFAAAINLVLGLSLVRMGKKRGSRVLRANGEHVLTDVWTSGGVLVAIMLIYITGWKWWDPLMAAFCALNILRTGIGLIRECLGGLLDETDPEVEKKIRGTLEKAAGERGVSYHNLRYRHSGRTHWVEFHLVFDDGVSVGSAHDAATQIEESVARLLEPDGRVISHLEPRSAESRVESWEGW